MPCVSTELWVRYSKLPSSQYATLSSEVKTDPTENNAFACHHPLTWYFQTPQNQQKRQGGSSSQTYGQTVERIHITLYLSHLIKVVITITALE